MAVTGPKQQTWEVEAKENIRYIRELMDRPTQHSTFSGLSGVIAGSTALIGCGATYKLTIHDHTLTHSGLQFVIIWAAVVLISLLADFVITKRPAAQVGKVLLSRLGRQMFLAAVPALFTGVIITLFFVYNHVLNWAYPVWMLTYGCAVCSVAAFSPGHVRILGWTFLACGALTLFAPQYGLEMVALSFGIAHIIYGVIVSPGVANQ